ECKWGGAAPPRIRVCPAPPRSTGYGNRAGLRSTLPCGAAGAPPCAVAPFFFYYKK
ncbi:hypothetical protein TorRG33x02_018780, partial [Trema orientale]